MMIANCRDRPGKHKVWAIQGDLAAVSQVGSVCHNKSGIVWGNCPTLLLGVADPVYRARGKVSPLTWIEAALDGSDGARGEGTIQLAAIETGIGRGVLGHQMDRVEASGAANLGKISVTDLLRCHTMIDFGLGGWQGQCEMLKLGTTLVFYWG